MKSYSAVNTRAAARIFGDIPRIPPSSQPEPFCHETCSKLEQQKGSRIPLPGTAVVLLASSLHPQFPLVSLPSWVHDLRWQFSQCHDKGNSSSIGEFSGDAHPQSLPRYGRALEGRWGPALCFVKRICRDTQAAFSGSGCNTMKLWHRRFRFILLQGCVYYTLLPHSGQDLSTRSQALSL